MKSILFWALTLTNAALLIVSTTVVFIPEVRTPAMHIALITLTFVVGAETIWRLRKDGTLNMTPAQIYASSDPSKPRATLLSAVASIMAAVALVVLSR